MEMLKIGTGTTTRKHVSKTYWFVEGLPDDFFSVRKINSHHVPAGEAKTISLKQLMDKFIPEIEFYEENTIPSMEQLEEFLDEGELHREEGQLYSAESSFNKALGLDEKNVRALFNLGLIYLELKDMSKAKDMMGDLLNVKSAFSGKNQHLFNEFGISLRKSRLFDEANAYYSHALKYAENDEHLYYNIARAHYECSNWEACIASIKMALAINPELEIAHNLVSVIQTLGNRPHLCEQNNKERIPNSIIKQVKEIFGNHPELDPKGVEPHPDWIRFNSNTNQPETGRVRSGNAPEDIK